MENELDGFSKTESVYLLSITELHHREPLAWDRGERTGDEDEVMPLGRCSRTEAEIG